MSEMYQRYVDSLDAKTGDSVHCPSCNKVFVKKYKNLFCHRNKQGEHSSHCRSNYWMSIRKHARLGNLTKKQMVAYEQKIIATQNNRLAKKNAITQRNRDIMKVPIRPETTYAYYFALERSITLLKD